METTLETVGNPTRLDMNDFIRQHKAVFWPTDTKVMIFDLMSNVRIFTKLPEQEWEQATQVYQGSDRDTALNKYNQLP